MRLTSSADRDSSSDSELDGSSTFFSSAASSVASSLAGSASALASSFLGSSGSFLLPKKDLIGYYESMLLYWRGVGLLYTKTALFWVMNDLL